MVEQGDILKVEGVKDFVVVLSNNYLNQSDKIIACPLIDKEIDSTFLLKVKLEDKVYYVEYDDIKTLDLKARGFRVRDRITLHNVMRLVDSIQSFFDFY